MLPIHAALTFLTMDQALNALSGVSKQPATQEDLLSLCEDGQCKLYVSIGGVHGFTQRTGELEEVREKVFCAGLQQVHSVRAVRRARLGSQVTVQVAGPVFLEGDSFEDVIRVWECEIDIGAVELLFRSADISNLVESLAVMARPVKTLGTRERDSWSAVVAGLALAAGIDMKHADSAATTIIHAGAGKVPMPSPNTIVKIIKQAALLLRDDDS